jgi:membrane dipeptidase
LGSSSGRRLRHRLLFLLWLLLPVSGHALPHSLPDLPVVDLRVGLVQSAALDPSLAIGTGQAGYVQFAKGGVVGALLPVPRAAESAPRTALASYLRLRTALEVSNQFAFNSCRRSAGSVSAWLELEAPDELAQEPTAVGLWVARGVRVFGIAGARDNELGSAASPFAPGPVTGLTATGRDLVARIFAARALVDVSGASELTIDDVVQLAKAAHLPVIATHSNARALADEPRNLSDATIREIAATGGLVAVTAVHGLLAPGRTATLRHLVRQIVYLVKLVGAEHVALGIGFEAGVSPPSDFGSAADFPRLALLLGNAGLSRGEIKRIFADNAWRVLCTDSAERAH